MRHFPQVPLPIKATMLALIAGVLGYQITSTHLPIRTLVGGVNIGLLSPSAAQILLSTHFSEVPPHVLTLSYEDATLASSSAELGARYTTNEIIDQFEAIHQAPLSLQKIWQSYQFFFQEHDLPVKTIYNEERSREFVSVFKKQVDRMPTLPKAVLKTSGSLQSLIIDAGTQGAELQEDKTLNTLISLHEGKSARITPVLEPTGKVLTELQLQAAKEMYTRLVGKSIILKAERFSHTLTDQTLISLVDPDAQIIPAAFEKEIALWQKQVETDPIEAEFTYNPQTLVVTSFTPPRDGRKLSLLALQEALMTYIHSLTPLTAKETVLDLKLVFTPPTKGLAETNDLGIAERIGFGESYYAHSIPNRVHNVALTTERISLHIVKPGEEFSFNKTVGDVSAQTGYKSAYVIKNGQTTLGDGGGVCQVSTTLFRSVLNAGLHVTRRLPHSYRVSYYELDRKPGVDATVYSGETDFRFINDTDHHILVYAQADSKKLAMYVELYGTSDGRTTEIVDHKTWNARPALPPQYIPDPTLPPGKIVQVDWAAPGIDASFKNVIKDKNGSVIREDIYVSKYRPWAAKYLKGV